MTTSQKTRPALGQIAKDGGMALVAAVVINAVLFFVGAALGAFPETVLSPMGVPIDVVAVIGASIFGVVVATIGYFVITRVLDLGRANQVFTIVLALVILASLFSPFSLAGAPILMIVILEVMHFVVGGALYYFLVR